MPIPPAPFVSPSTRMDMPAAQRFVPQRDRTPPCAIGTGGPQWRRDFQAITVNRDTLAARLIAHRGDWAHYPENTLLALRAACRTGVGGVEFDVQLSADGVPLLMHDADLQRTTGVAADVRDLTLARLSALSAGEPARFGDRFAAEPIPSLRQAVQGLVPWPDVTAYVEIKAESIARFGPKPVVQAVIDCLLSCAGRCVPISYDAEAMAEARRQGAERIGWVLSAWDDAARRDAQQLSPAFLFCDQRLIPPAATLWPGPWTWVVYDICAPEQARRWWARGVGLIESRDPLGLLSAS